MPKSKQMLIIFFAALVVFGYNYFLVYYPYISRNMIWRDIKLAEKALKPSLNPQKAIENDNTIRLALFYQINKEDPLYYGPGLNIDDFQDSVNRLKESQIDLKNVLELDEDVYPVEFLQATVDAAKASKLFESDSTIENAKVMIKAERKATQQYRNYANFLRAKLNRSKLPTELFSQGGAITSKDIIVGDLEKTVMNSRKLDSEISRRERCLVVSTIFCNRLELKPFNNLPDISVGDPVTFPSRNTQSERQFVTSGTYQIVSPCWKQYTTSPEIHLIYALENNDEKLMIPQLADNRYFEPLSPEGFGESLYDEYIKLGIDWKVTYMDNAYTCNNLEYQPSLTTVNAYYKQFASKPLLGSVDIGSLPAELQLQASVAKDEENAFATEKYPSEVTLGKIAVSYAKIYNELVSVSSKSEVPNKFTNLAPLKSDLLYRFRYINNRLADYPENLNFLSLRNTGHARISEVNLKGQIELNYVYFMRNAYSVTLLGFSPSVWRSEDRLDYLDKDTKMYASLMNNTDFVKKFGELYADKIESITRDQVVGELFKALEK